MGRQFAAIRFTRDVMPRPCAAIGFCFGGMYSILMARMGLPLRGVVGFHGLLKIGDPLDARAQPRILVLHGQDDPMVPPADIGIFATEVQRIEARWALHAYPGGHAWFHESTRERSGFRHRV